jgi:hypothetical protein
MPDKDTIGTATFTRRALEVVALHELSLGYMAASGLFDADDPDHPFDDNVARFMVFSTTDGRDDGWVDFAATALDAAARVRAFVGDEWGVANVFDLAADDYVDPVTVEVTVRVARAEYTVNV